MKKDARAAADAMARAVEGMTMGSVIDGAIILMATVIGVMRTETDRTPEQTELLFETFCRDLRAKLVANGHLPPSMSH
jgi:hypothetical protein